MGSDFHRIFYLKREGTSYWAMPSWDNHDRVQWTMCDKVNHWVHDVPIDDVPKSIKVEYLLWLMQVDKR